MPFWPAMLGQSPHTCVGLKAVDFSLKGARTAPGELTADMILPIVDVLIIPGETVLWYPVDAGMDCTSPAHRVCLVVVRVGFRPVTGVSSLGSSKGLSSGSGASGDSASLHPASGSSSTSDHRGSDHRG